MKCWVEASLQVNIYIYMYSHVYTYIFIYFHVFYVYIYIICVCKWNMYIEQLENHVKAWSNQFLGQLTPAWSIQFSDSGSTSESRFIRKSSRIFYNKNLPTASLFTAHISSTLIMTMCVCYIYLNVGHVHHKQRKCIPYIWVKLYHTNCPSWINANQILEASTPFVGWMTSDIVSKMHGWDWYKVGPEPIVINGVTWGP